MTDKEIQQRCKDEWDMQVEIFRSCYSKGYNDAKRELALSGEYERAYQRGRDSVIAILNKIRTEIEELADAKGYGDYQLGYNFGLMRAAQVIDKYKAETE